MGERTVRVLLINDESTGALALKDAMMHAGFEVMTAPDGWTGLEHIRQRHPDAVIWAQPRAGAGGRDLKQLLEHDPATETIPFLFLFLHGAPSPSECLIAAGSPEPCAVCPEDVVAQVEAALREGFRGDSPTSLSAH